MAIAFLLFWIVVAVISAIGEMMTAGLFLAALAAAAALTGLSALFLPLLLQVALFAGLSIAGLAFIRPLAVHALALDRVHDAGRLEDRSHIQGKHGIVTQTVDMGGGQIRIGNGEFWSARPYEPGDVIPAGRQVEVLLVDNLTALVAPDPTPSPPPSETDSPV